MSHPTPPPEPPFSEHFLVFMTLTEGRPAEELARIADLLEAVGACMDAAAETAARRLNANALATADR